MANGHALPLPFELGSTPAPQPQQGIEQTIGIAVAAAATVLAAASLEKHYAGVLSQEVRSASGEKIAAVFALQQAHANIAFEEIARREGRRVLEPLAAGCAPGVGDVIADELIDAVMAIVAKVTAFERAMAN